MKVFKRLIASALILVTILAFSACDFSAKEYKASDDSYFKYTAVEGGYEVSAGINVLPEVLNLPESYNGLPVVAVAEGGFANSVIKELAIPMSVKEIGANAFNGSTLESVYFFTGVQVIGDGAFYGCANLKTLNLPKSVITLGQSAFGACTSISSVTISEKVKNVGNACFAYCTSLSKVYIPRSVSFIGESAFVGCSEDIAFEISASNEYYKLDENGYPVER